MIMNKTLWNYYKHSSDGKKAIDLFNPEPNDTYQAVERIAEFLKNWDKDIDPHHLGDGVFIYEVNIAERHLLSEEPSSRNTFETFVETYDLKEFDLQGENVIWSEDRYFIPVDKFRQKAATVDALSMYLYYCDSYFKPILLPRRFDIIQRSCDVLGIELPPIPHTKDYKEFLMYYYDICGVLNEFQQKNEMTDAELCACLYDYGARVLLDDKSYIEGELPQPTNIWLTGASGKGDFDFLDSLGKQQDSKTSIWACNERTRKGDLIIVYCTSPRSYLHSIWRADSAGIFNPFDYYHCRTTVRDGVRLPQISFSDLKEDSYFSQLPIVRRNLQGVNGIELSAKDYSELLKLVERKGGNTADYPQLYIGGTVDFGDIRLEKDVEENILIPLLKRIGYNDSDWTRQLQLKAGRKEKAIPDFVFFPQGATHFESAPLVIEAKLDMSSMVEEQKAFRQALSYARLLRSKLMGICDKERLVIYALDSSGSCNIERPLFDNHWQAIYSDETIGAKLNQLIGAEVIKEK